MRSKIGSSPHDGDFGEAKTSPISAARRQPPKFNDAARRRPSLKRLSFSSRRFTAPRRNPPSTAHSFSSSRFRLKPKINTFAAIHIAHVRDGHELKPSKPLVACDLTHNKIVVSLAFYGVSVCALSCLCSCCFLPPAAAATCVHNHDHTRDLLYKGFRHGGSLTSCERRGELPADPRPTIVFYRPEIQRYSTAS